MMQNIIWDMNPIMLKIGSIEVRWYGVFFATAILIGYKIFYSIFKREKQNMSSLDPLLYLL
ncbi:MAG: prolipoprotein diacylglyceryl transferase family protein, partial [Lentisphaeria bacterium]